MDDPITEEEIVAIIADYCRAEVSEDGEFYVFTAQRRQQEIALRLAKSSVAAIGNQLTTVEPHDETALVSDQQYEIIVREEGEIPFRRLRNDKIEVENEEAGLKYELSPATDAYLIWLLVQMRRKLDPRDMRIGMLFGSRLERWLEEEQELSPLEYIRLSSFRWLTLKISSQRRVTAAQFSKFTHAFLFHVGYNLDIALVPQRLLDEIVRHGRISRMRRSRIEDLDPPRRTYNEDLVQHYLLAVSTENPVIEYLSYYHIFEHFFESVFNEDLVDSIKSKITDPGFSYKRKKDINQLIGTIKKSLQIRSETITFSESEALRLCIGRFVDINELCEKLDAYDETLTGFYKSNDVVFSSGPAVDLRNVDTEEVVRKLTKRIYATRNALVHSKEGERSKYTPFRDDRTLVKEVPLLRFASEMVILSESMVQ